MGAVAGVVLSSFVAAANVWSTRDGGVLDVDAIGLIAWLPAATLSVVLSSMAYRSAARSARPLWSVIVAGTAASAVTLALLAQRDGFLTSPVQFGATAAAVVYAIGASVRALRSA
jgi:hypothetical protein